MEDQTEFLTPGFRAVQPPAIVGIYGVYCWMKDLFLALTHLSISPFFIPSLPSSVSPTSSSDRQREIDRPEQALRKHQLGAVLGVIGNLTQKLQGVSMPPFPSVLFVLLPHEHTRGIHPLRKSHPVPSRSRITLTGC